MSTSRLGNVTVALNTVSCVERSEGRLSVVCFAVRAPGVVASEGDSRTTAGRR